MATQQSALLLRKQLHELKRHPVEGFSAGLIDDEDIYNWEVLIIGPQDTPYEGGFFKAHLIFPREYPQKPPKMLFKSQIWHPNVDKEGNVCISILHDPGDDKYGYEMASERWLPIHTVETILVSVISMLADPNDESPANIDAAEQSEYVTKLKHYFFYSTLPGYGKTTNVGKMMKWLNWTRVSPDAQFLIIDEYGLEATSRLSLDRLKSLTSGNASLFSGNRKSHGQSYRPRPDAQLVMFSNYHLFECMGRGGHGKTRRVTEEVARILKDRIRIHRMDEGDGAGGDDDPRTELSDARRFCLNPDADFLQD